MRIRILAALLLCLLLTGCGGEKAEPLPMPTAVVTPTAVPTVEPTAESTPAPTSAPTSAPTEEPEPIPSSFASYTLPLGAAVPIYKGPGRDSGYVCDVGQDGVYTIVEEAPGDDGSLWGRLKSGVGWVNLGGTPEEEVIPPFTADYAFPELLESGDMARCIVDNGEGFVQLMVLPHETLRDVSLEMLTYGESGYAVDCIYDIFPELSAAWPLVADVVFYGDMTAYGLSFTDESGIQRHFAITMSGFDSSLVATEYH